MPLPGWNALGWLARHPVVEAAWKCVEMQLSMRMQGNEARGGWIYERGAVECELDGHSTT